MILLPWLLIIRVWALVDLAFVPYFQGYTWHTYISVVVPSLLKQASPVTAVNFSCAPPHPPMLEARGPNSFQQTTYHPAPIPVLKYDGGRRLGKKVVLGIEREKQEPLR